MVGFKGKSRWIAGALVGAGLVLSSISPAEARPRYGYGGGYGGWDGHHRHHRGRDNGFGVGDAIGVAALVGAVAIVASSISKDKKAAQRNDAPVEGPGQERGYDAPPPVDGTDYGTDHQADDSGYNQRQDEDFSDIANADDGRMAGACAIAARNEAQGEGGGYAEIRHMDQPRAVRDGYDIDGEVETRASYRAIGGETRRFTCSMRGDQVAAVYISRDVAP